MRMSISRRVLFAIVFKKCITAYACVVLKSVTCYDVKKRYSRGRITSRAGG